MLDVCVHSVLCQTVANHFRQVDFVLNQQHAHVPILAEVCLEEAEKRLRRQVLVLTGLSGFGSDHACR